MSKSPQLPPPSIADGLARIYQRYLLSLEQDYRFHQLYSPIMTNGDFKAEPMILLLGQYSTGKTTFVRHLLEKDYPGLRVGPEPTTDKFIVVCSTEDDSIARAEVLPGHAAVVDNSLPWSQLQIFGPTFLSKLEVVHVQASIFKGITLIDTPGVLAGNKQLERGYDFEGVIKWFGERVDLVLLFFDSYKLDISDEFRRCIQALRGNDSKICIILNKADSVSPPQLMRVHGALMWSLGKVMQAPEVPLVRIGSFWDQPLKNEECRRYFEAESESLFKLIYSLPARSASRKIDDLLKRVRLCRVHCILVDHLRKQTPFFSRGTKRIELLSRLSEFCEFLSNEYKLPLSDFPDISDLRPKLESLGQFRKFPKLETKRLRALEEEALRQIADLTRLIPFEEAAGRDAARPRRSSEALCPSPFFSESLRATTWIGASELEPEIRSLQLPPWAFKKYLMTKPDPLVHMAEFRSLAPDEIGGILSGSQVKPYLEQSRLPTVVLHRIWNLADIDKDGFFDIYEFALARHFIDMKLNGFELPPFLPACLKPEPPRNHILRKESSNTLGLGVVHIEHNISSSSTSSEGGSLGFVS